MDNRQRLAIGGPVGFLDVVQQIARSIGADGELSQRTNVRESRVAEAKAMQYRHLTCRRNCHYFRLRESQIARLGRIWRADKDRLRIAFPSSAIDGRARVRSKPGCHQGAAPEG